MFGGALDTREPYGTPFYELDQIVDFAKVLQLEVQLDVERDALLERRVIATRNMRTGEERPASYFDEYPEQRALRPAISTTYLPAIPSQPAPPVYRATRHAAGCRQPARAGW
ncbi:hypothetical protein [Cupriavidus lacunae]|uniref:hypothetical protein n=1 Tax=Cupriavidus lacunae TaxID=2666307 RepID=UPI00142E5926|nr:hypothetical protein [Cupriavidus lacunae]